ncbi:MAG: hypothetical protein ACKVT1_05580 [Dehalococcoidia bacterium]
MLQAFAQILEHAEAIIARDAVAETLGTGMAPMDPDTHRIADITRRFVKPESMLDALAQIIELAEGMIDRDDDRKGKGPMDDSVYRIADITRRFVPTSRKS